MTSCAATRISLRNRLGETKGAKAYRPASAPWANLHRAALAPKGRCRSCKESVVSLRTTKQSLERPTDSPSATVGRGLLPRSSSSGELVGLIDSLNVSESLARP